ncbi:hypothetical protein DQM68_19635 (plasmid) [Leptospira mayottensis]|uniref:Uncharacterized protein n=2 Tax=Leptospira mayottensis TaxID=1137606 RepID=M6V6L0_9LEPT|nr:hypothetical protein [Leptospira mayottensis]AVH81567.1 hypothetical protein [Leptospira mayottensis 200901116]AXR62869.1 hypothetical protein DQM68_19635 [Leptospira mayottensis]TGN00398.1 hypothetical protein EHR03_13115 [Leptospira mayottensis]
MGKIVNQNTSISTDSNESVESVTETIEQSTENDFTIPDPNTKEPDQKNLLSNDVAPKKQKVIRSGEDKFCAKHPTLTSGTIFIPYPNTENPTTLEIDGGNVYPETREVLDYLIRREGWKDLSEYARVYDEVTNLPQKKTILWYFKIPGARDDNKVTGSIGVSTSDGNKIIEFKENIVETGDREVAEQLASSGFTLFKKDEIDVD